MKRKCSQHLLSQTPDFETERFLARKKVSSCFHDIFLINILPTYRSWKQAPSSYKDTSIWSGKFQNVWKISRVYEGEIFQSLTVMS